jgi:Leucine-rich repeat (LRR) protein
MTQITPLSDEKIIKCLKSLCDFSYIIKNNVCTNISFYDENSIFGGTIRRHSNKHQIIAMVSKLQHLTHLNVRKCKIGHLPEIRSKNLEYLDISCNDIESVPKWISQQYHLKFLNMGANKIKNLPDLSDIPLDTLKVHKNQITKLPKINRNIKSLNLFLNPMSNIPNDVFKLSLLETFSFGVTNIKSITSIPLLKNLRWLTLTVNQIEYLPEDICCLKKLEGLQLAKNKINKLPNKIGDLNIEHFTLYSNNIKELPESFFELQLKKLNLAKNPLMKKYQQLVFEKFNNIDFLRLT